MSRVHNFKKKTLARPHIISFLQPLCLINYYFFHNTVIFSTTLHFSKALSKPPLGSVAASTEILTWFIFPGTFSSLMDIKRATVLNIHMHKKENIFWQLQKRPVCISFLHMVHYFSMELISCAFPHARICPVLPLISYLIHVKTSGFSNNDDTKKLNLIVLLGRSVHQRMTTWHCCSSALWVYGYTKQKKEIQMPAIWTIKFHFRYFHNCI